MKYYIVEKGTGLIDGYYEDELVCKCILSVLNKLCGNNKFVILESIGFMNKDINEIKLLNNFPWFIDDKNVDH